MMRLRFPRRRVRVVWAAGLVVAATALAGRALAAGGMLIVKSDPDGADVYVGAEEASRGKTPLAIPDFPRGQHKVRVVLAGYAEQTQEVSINPGGYRVLEFKLSKSTWRPASTKTGGAPAPASSGGTFGGTSGETSGRTAGGASDREATGKADDEAPKNVDVNCPACKGSGLLKEIGCRTCRATGYVGAESCDKCGGGGRVEYGCPYCKGQGKTVAGGRELECRGCKGKGFFPCMACKGKGTISRRNPEAAGCPTKDCPMCDGTGFPQRAKCTVCAGRGKVRIGRNTAFGTGPGMGGGRGLGNLFQMVDCVACGGDGECQPICRVCHGKGYRGSSQTPAPCTTCFGTGHAFTPCAGCRGQGWVKEGN